MGTRTQSLVINIIETLDSHIPPPAALLEPLRGIIEHDLVPVLNIHRLVRHLLAQCRDIFWLER